MLSHLFAAGYVYVVCKNCLDFHNNNSIPTRLSDYGVNFVFKITQLERYEI